MTFKEFKTRIRKAIGWVNVGETIEDCIDGNSPKTWAWLFSNQKFLKSYVEPNRLRFYDEIATIIQKHINQNQLSKIIDFGCGTGHLLKAIEQRCSNLQIEGTDFVDESLEIAKKILPNAQFFKHDIYEQAPLLENQYDVVLCTEVLEHLLYPKKALHNLKSYVKQGGILVLTVPDGRKDTYTGHINFWSPESWKIFIEESSCEFAVKEHLLIDGNTSIMSIIKK